MAQILTVQPGSPPIAAIHPDMVARLQRISTGNSNGSTPIVLLKFPFIGSTMLAHGLFSPANKGGSGLARLMAQSRIADKNSRFRTGPRGENPHPKIWVHNINAVSVAQFYTLAAQGRMIDAATSKAVLGHLRAGGCTTVIDLTDLYASGQFSTKCGIFAEWVHNSVFSKEPATLREFVVVILTRNRTFGVMKDLFRDLVALVP